MMGVDVRMAYLYGKLDEEIYMCQPEGFIATGQENKVIHLQRALYGLKQAGLAWWKELSQSMKVLGFKRLNSDARIFMCREGTELIMAVVYVDDAMFFGKNKKLVDKKKALFMNKWECHDLGEVKEFLHMQVRRQGLDITINQVDYLKKVLEQFQMTNTKATQTPLVMIRPRIYRGVIKGTFHFSFHLSLVSLERFTLHFIPYLSSVNPSHMSVSTMSMLPLYSVHTQVSETCFTHLLFCPYLFQKLSVFKP
jgi:Reverse transcriptase (RNA-dependent DNA polymerase)